MCRVFELPCSVVDRRRQLDAAKEVTVESTKILPEKEPRRLVSSIPRGRTNGREVKNSRLGLCDQPNTRRFPWCVFFLIEHRSCWCLVLICGSEMPSDEPAAVGDLLVDAKGSSGLKIGHRSMFVHRNPVVDDSDPSVGMHDVPASGVYDHDGLQSFLW